MFNKILIANRGEIACRIIATAKRMGISTVAIYSTIDAAALHVKQADEAYLVGEAPSQQSYLNINRIIDIAKQAHVDAIHPGYGFLAENSSFALACSDAGVVFIGPPAEAITQMGDKSLAKNIMSSAQVPVIPGYQGEQQDVSTLTAKAKEIGLPLLIKAVAGGGGKGMRLVTNFSEFNKLLASAKREAQASFANDHVMLEKYIKPARHIEIQIFCDQYGKGVYLADRDCSIQRRHQKVIEEAPAPNLPDQLRSTMGNTAVKAALAINYVGAGTMEFLVDEKFNYYFMEMNTRLQVEHPVTEMVTGLDLVEWQLSVASGEPLACSQKDIKIEGHAVEARICAENPYQDYTPSAGKLNYFDMPVGKDLRIDTGVAQGDTISPYYDSMIAKCIAFAPNREQAIVKLLSALMAIRIIGVDTNVGLLSDICKQVDFQQAHIDTDFIEKHQNVLIDSQSVCPPTLLIAAAIAKWHIQDHDITHQSNDLFSPWLKRDHWRADKQAIINLNLWCKQLKYSLSYQFQGHNQIVFFINEKSYQVRYQWQTSTLLELKLHDQTHEIEILHDQNTTHLFYQGHHYEFQLNMNQTQQGQSDSKNQSFIAPMPGTVVKVLVTSGQQVNKNDQLLVIEAMKMEHVITAPQKGTVVEVYFKDGDSINEGAQMLSFEQS